MPPIPLSSVLNFRFRKLQLMHSPTKRLLRIKLREEKEEKKIKAKKKKKLREPVKERGTYH